MPTTTKAAAPALMPMMPGSASGLRVTPWRIAPLSPSAAPTLSPSSVRGTRISCITFWDADAGSKSVSACQTVSSATSREPSVTLRADHEQHADQAAEDRAAAVVARRR